MEDLNKIDGLFEDLNSKDNKIRYNALLTLMKITDKKILWVYDKWYDLERKLYSDNSYQRSIGLMLLANLCKSDTESRFDKIIARYIELFEDEKFITSRQCIQNSWKIAAVKKLYCSTITEALEHTYYENIHLKSHANLIKADVIFSLCRISEHTGDESIIRKAGELIENENDAKLKKDLSKVLATEYLPE